MPESAFMLAPKDTAWSWLADVTDRAQVEWQELADELEHKGPYRAGTGRTSALVCDHCEWRHTVLHPEQLGTCPECGADEYRREPLSPLDFPPDNRYRREAPHGAPLISTSISFRPCEPRDERGGTSARPGAGRAAMRTWASCQNAGRVSPLGGTAPGSQDPGLELRDLGD